MHLCPHLPVPCESYVKTFLQANQKQRKGSKGSAKTPAAGAGTDASTAVGSPATKAKATAVAGDSTAAKTTAEPVVVTSDATPAETAEVAAQAPLQGKSA